MNCKPGDLAIIVRVMNEENLGEVVEVIRLASMDRHVLAENGITYDFGVSTRWVIRSAGRPLKHSVGWPDSEWHIARDCNLRPIRPTDGEDETLQWAGKPN